MQRTRLPYNDRIEWTHYLTRPFTLFGASVWQTWYDSRQIKQLLGIDNHQALFLEEQLNVVRYYKEKKQLAGLRAAIQRIAKKEPDRLMSMYQRAVGLNDSALKILKKGPSSFGSLEEAVHFTVDLAIHATIIPNTSLFGFADDVSSKNTQLFTIAEKLRATSLYPRMLDEIILHHVRKILKKNHIPVAASDLFTINEIRKCDFSKLDERRAARKAHKQFVYQVTRGTEMITWVDDVRPFVEAIEGVPLLNASNALSGQIAFKGKARGIARLVLSASGRGVLFHKGDILVTINSNPMLMPLILKCAAIVTDEGGIACHAAIVSRELKKPCVMGTKYATRVIKNGDLIEVDANKGIVTKLENS